MLNIQLRAAGLTKVQLAKNLGITTSAISKWNDVAPKYVYAYLEQYIENRELKNGKAWLKKWLED